MTATNQPAGGVSTGPGGMTLLTYYKIATASEPASYTWTFANPVLGQGGSAVGGILTFSGVDTSVSPIDVWSARLTPNGTTHATNSITPTVINTMIVSSISYLSASSFANPTGIPGITERLDVSAPVAANAIGTTLQMATAPWATTTATGASQAVAAAFADTGVGHLMALRPSNVDLAMVMTRSGPLIPGGSASYTLTVTNSGSTPESGPLTVVDTLPAGLTYASFSGSGWTCGVSGQVVTCTRPGALAAGATAPALVLNVNVDAGASGTLTNTAIVSGIGGDGNLANNTAVDSYTIPGSTTAYAYYAMDEFSWTGAPNEVADSSGNNRHGVRVGNANTVNPGKVCRGGDIPDNTSAIDTGIDVNAALGSRGTVTFWYKSDTDWDDGTSRMLLDASNNLGNGNADKYFFLVKEGGGRLRFRLEDSADTDTQARTGGNAFAADTWVHIGITWDLLNDRTEIYINGVLQDASTTNVNGTLGNTNTLYLGDNRTGGVGGGGYTNRSANGVLDESRIYDRVLSAGDVIADMNATHVCPPPPPGLNFFDIIVPTFATVCGPATITIVAKDAGDNPVTDYVGLINLSTSTNRGDWSVSVAAGTLNNGAGNDGAATYQFVLADAGTIQLNLAVTNQGILTVTVQDPGLGVSNTSASIDFRRGNRTLVITNDPIQVADRLQAMTVARLRNDCSVDTGFNATRNMRAWITRDPSDPGGAAPSINGVALPNADPGFNNLAGASALVFVNGVADFLLATTDVGKYVLNLRDGNDRGSSDPITTRPFGLGFTVIQQGAATPNLGGTATTGTAFIAAGDTFEATVGGYRWSGADDGNNDGIPDAGSDITNNGLTASYAWTTVLSASTHTPAGGAGTLGGSTSVAPASFTAAPAGSATVNDLTYSEVGSMRLQANATNYLNTPGVNLSGLSGVVGRFFPDHFTRVTGNIAAGCGGVMTYMGQPNLGIAYNIEARNKANVKTSNYIDPGYNVGSVTLMAENNNDGTNLFARLSGTPSATWTSGTYNASTAAANFTRAGSLDGAFDVLLIGVQVSDADSPVIQGLDMNPTTTGDCVAAANCTGKAIDVATSVRYGRVAIQNAFGSELLPLPVPMHAQSYKNSDTGFTIETNDGCTTLLINNLKLSNLDDAGSPIDGPGPIIIGTGAQNTTANLTNPTLVGGDAGLSFSAPGAGGDGYVDITVDLAALPWLKFEWDANPGPDDPAGRATFGVYKGNNRHIYLRERY